MAMDRRRFGSGYLPLREAIDQLFEGSVISPAILSAQGGFPQVDMHVTENDVILEMAAPGIDPDDVNISVTGDTVTIAGEVKRQQRSEKGQTLHEEIWRGRFQRSFQLPMQVDANGADASFHNGVMTLRLPKSEATKPRKIQVRQGHPTIQQGQGQQPQSGDVQSETVPVQQG